MCAAPFTRALRTFGSAAELAGEVARLWLETVRLGQCGTVALSGGRSAVELFRAVHRLSVDEPADWGLVHFFWADERCVGPDDPGSNFGLARRELLGPSNIQAERVHRIRGEWEPGIAAKAAEDELLQCSDGRGTLDLVLLGMGEDGHVASAFPGAEAVWGRGDRLYLPAVSLKPPVQRVTLTLGAMVQARQVWVLVVGSGKGGILERALQGDPRLPLSRLLSGRCTTQVFAAE